MVIYFFTLLYTKISFTTFYSQTKSSVPPQDSISELIIWKMKPLVVPVTGVKFKAAFLHA